MLGLKEALLGHSKGQLEGLRAWGGLGGRGETTAEQKVPQAQEAPLLWWLGVPPLGLPLNGQQDPETLMLWDLRRLDPGL